MSPMTDSDPSASFTFAHPLRVRWAEVDAQGVVFNPQYFVFADVAMTEYMRALEMPYPAAFAPYSTDLYAVHAEARFRGSARYDDLLTLHVRVAHIGTTSARYETLVARDDAPLVEVIMTYANTGLASGRPEPLPAEFVDRVLAYERTPPTRKSASG